MKPLHQLLLALFLLSGLSLTAQTEYKFNNKQDGFSISSRSTTATTIVHNVSGITIENSDRKEVEGQFITLSGIHISNQAGAPDLPSGSTFVAIPNGATPTIKMVSARTKTLKNIDLIPAPQPQLDNDDSPAVYQKDMSIYGRNAFYPATPFQISETLTVRGMEMVQVGVMPFQYNPVTKELIVYEDLELELTTEGGDGTYGDIRYRTPEWDQILQDMLLNREVLPEVDYGAKLRKHYENREIGCELMIITPDNEEFVQLADSIKKFRTSQGVPTEVFTVSQCGGNNGTSIRTFIRNAYLNWDMPPASVLILGDHSTDPTLGVVSYSMNNHPNEGYNPYISDHRYAVIGNDHMPNIIMGRITGRNYDELYHMIKKDLDYERTPPTNPSFYDEPITAMGFQLERWFQLCSEVINGFFEYEFNKHPVRVNAIYEGTPGSRWSTYEYTNAALSYFGPNGCGYIPQNMSHLTDWSGTGDKVNECINNGAFILQHRDHGSEELWGEPRYNIGHINRLANPDLTYVMSCNCLTGRFNYTGNNGEGCFAEVFHRHQHGALGLIAATQVSYSFVNDVYVWGSYDNMWPNFMPTYGTEHPTNFVMPAFGNAAGKYFLSQSSWAGDYTKEITYYLFHHHGDPYMNLYSEIPQPLDVEMLPVIPAGSDQYQLKVDEGATICLTANGQIIGFDYGTGETQTIDIIPQEVGTRVLLTIRKQNYYRYEHELATIPNDTPYLIYHSLEINDEDGNGNQMPDYNETCRLSLSIHNVGSANIEGVKTRITCQNPDVQIIENEATYGSINNGETSMVENAFAVHFDESINDGEIIRLFLNMENNSFSFIDSIDLRVNAPVINCTGVSYKNLEGETTDRFFQGETSLMTFDLTNSGQSKSLGLSSTLNIHAPFLDIVENPIELEPIEAGETAQVTFQVNIHDDAPKGNILDYTFEAQSGVRTIQKTDHSSLGYTSECFEDDELNSNLQWNLGTGSKKWYIVEDSSATDGYCLRSPSLTSNSSAKLAIGLSCATPETFSFLHKVSIGGNDELELNINSTVVDILSGESDWGLSTFELREGQNLIKITYKKNSEGGEDDCVLIDHMLFPPLEELYIFAGDDAESCPNTTFTPNSCSLHQNEILWSSDGDGSFDDPTLEQPSYTFGDNDKLNGTVTLTMTANGTLHNDQQSDAITIALKESVENVNLEAPEGDTLVDLRLNSQTAYLSPFEGEVRYTWSLEPEDAGTLNAEESQVTIDWNEAYRGMATLTYMVSNECGDSEASQALSIHVMNSTGVNESQTGNIEVYPNPAHEQVYLKATGIEDGETSVRLIDILGRVVLETKAVSTNGVFESRLSTVSLQSGIYNIQVINREKTYNLHLVIK